MSINTIFDCSLHAAIAGFLIIPKQKFVLLGLFEIWLQMLFGAKLKRLLSS